MEPYIRKTLSYEPIVPTLVAVTGVAEFIPRLDVKLEDPSDVLEVDCPGVVLCEFPLGRKFIQQTRCEYSLFNIQSTPNKKTNNNQKRSMLDRLWK